MRYQRAVHGRYMQSEPMRQPLPDKRSAKCKHAFINPCFKLVEFAENTLVFAFVLKLSRIGKLLHQLIFPLKMLFGMDLQLLKQDRKIRIAGAIQLI